MRKFFTFWVAIGTLCCSLSLASAYTITDTGASAYWGGAVHNSTPTGYGDVIGSPYFNVDSMTVTRSGNNWAVAIAGPYFANRLTGIDSGFPSMLGPGDLYINSTGWIATQGPAGHYETDTFNSSEGWNYVITNGAEGWGLYSLDYSTIKYTNVDSLNPGNYIYRTGQAWRGGGVGDKIGDATYDPTGTGLNITFNSGNEFFADDVGFHWTMQCGNDVVEGKANAPVPEPGTMILLGSGLIGLAGYGRKRFRK
jgi:hypothetical protein